MSRKLSKDFTIVVAGQAGQGIESVASVLAHVLKKQGFHTYVAKDVMSRVRGGMNAITMRISNDRADAYKEKIDLFVPLDPRAYARYEKRFTKKTIFMGVDDPMNASVSPHSKTASRRPVMAINFIQSAHEVGNRLFANTIAAGAILGLLDVSKEIGIHYLRNFFRRKGQEIVDGNIEAFEKGFTFGSHVAYQEDITVTLKPKDDVEDYIFLSGAEAVGLGALGGGCNFISSYPMSPATGILTFLAQNGKECGVLVEQATDEIGAINMTLGASYAGARGIVTTSGGGFDLMTETISLSAMTETPIVVHIAQRPGPATGLPTRTAQEDLAIARHAGHGEYMRAIYTPGTPDQMYDLTAHALDVADKYQIPAFVLTDQMMMDSLYCAPESSFRSRPITHYVTKTKEDYKRYELTKDGLSPRGIPGHGEGFIHADSDEHDEEGRITEDMDGLRMEMTRKRLFKRKELLVDAALAPDVIKAKKSDTLIICWGSTKNVVEEAIENAALDHVTVAHFRQVYPLHKSVAELMSTHRKVVVLEGNATGQFADILEVETGEVVHERIGKWNGEPFSVEELTQKFKRI